MPAGDSSYDDHSLMQSYLRTNDSSYSTADESAASILKSVRAQEAQFERLTRELEAGRENVSQNLTQSRVGNETESMTSADDSYMWRGQAPTSQQGSFYEEEPSNLADTSKMSSHLLDSCLRELEDRGTLNTGYVREDGRMDYLHEDPYSIQYNSNPGYGGGSGNYGNPNMSYDREHSPHGSHMSLQSNGSNRGRTKMTPSSSRIINDEPVPQQNGNYATYQSINRPVEDLRASPYQRSDSPRDPRFSSNQLPAHYPEAPAHYGSSPRDSVARYSDESPYGEHSHYESHNFRENQYAGSRGSYNAPSDSGAPYQGQGHQPGYGDYEDRYPDPNHPTEYQDHPLNEPRPLNDDPYNGRHPDDIDRPYGEPPYHDQHYDDDGYRGPPRYDEQDGPRDPQYGSHPDDSFRGPQDDPGYRNSYQEQPYDPYGTRPVEGDPAYRGNYPEDPNVDPNDPRYRGSYTNHPEDHYGGSMGHPQDLDDSRYRNSYQGNPEDPYADRPGDDPELIRRMQGLPPLQKDPFADDPFKENPNGSYPGLRPGDEDPYRRGPSPSGGPGEQHYDDRGPTQYREEPSYDDRDPNQPYDSSAPPHYDYSDGPTRETNPYYPEEDIHPNEAPLVSAPPANDYTSEGRRTPPNAFGGWRAPDLPEVIDYLSHRDSDIKAHAAAYLQHLTFMDDGVKAKTRGLDGIRPLVQLLSNEYPEVHKSACGALQNLSYGRTNDENKKAIRNENGIPELIRLLRKSHEEDVRESVTGVLWNLSSCEDLKKPVIDDGLTVLVNVVIIPHSGYDRTGATPYRDHEPWTTTFRNATGVIRNVSSAGFEARKKLRECHGMVKALIHTLKIATEGDMDNKPVENVVCILRNLSYRIQEIEDPEFYKRRTLPRQPKQAEKVDSTGCFGGGGKNKKGAAKKGNEPNSPNQKSAPTFPPQAAEYKGLWGPEIVHLYSVLLKNASNPVTLEAAAGAVQNLTACEWQPAVDIRALVRKEKGLPNLVDLLTFESDRVVCAAATALRNLAIDERNKELVGKYAMQQLVRKLPQHRLQPGPVPPDDTLCAVIATLYEVIKNNQDFAQSLMTENGLPRLVNITKSEGQYLARTIKYAHTVLRTMWSFRALHPEYTRMGMTEKDFLMFTASSRPEGSKYNSSNFSSTISPAASNHTTPYNTLNRPISAQGYDDNTLSPGRPLQKRPNNNYDYSRNPSEGYFAMNQSNSHLEDRHNYSHDKGRPDEVPLQDLGPGYAPLDDQAPPHRTKPPVGGVALFPTAPNHDPSDPSGEPLYAKVNKKSQRRNDDYVHSSKIMLDSGGGPQGGADSWV